MALLFALTLFVSSTLLFLVQPMVGKMILPVLGGTPAVWNACMVFFQAMLLAGYGYAHLLSTRLRLGPQILLHLVPLLAAFWFLPIDVVAGSRPPEASDPVPWLLTRLLVTVGFPFFMVSTTAPLLQKWFASTGHRDAADPYFLYSASNVGSLLALLGYPVVFERLFWLEQQSALWRWAYLGLIGLLALCGWIAWSAVRRRVPSTAEAERSAAPAPAFASPTAAPDVPPLIHSANGRVSSALPPLIQSANGPAPADQPPTLWRRAEWIALSAIPSSLTLGVTLHITTDVAAIPLLWVIPLSVYLLTFVIVFARRPVLPHSVILRVVPYIAVIGAPLTLMTENFPVWWGVGINLVLFFFLALACHGELVRTRPAVSHLTEFYFWMSVGGVLGGIFNTLVAPYVFRTVLEYPLMIIAACAILPLGRTARGRRRVDWLDFALPALLAAAGVAVLYVLRRGGWQYPLVLVPIYFGLIVAGIQFRARPIRFALVLAAGLALMSTRSYLFNTHIIYRGRNFFGVKVVQDNADHTVREMLHGGTVHGAEFLGRPDPPDPLLYHHRAGPLGDVFATRGPEAKSENVAVIGLGIGAMAAFGHAGQVFVFYEIDPDVERIARDPNWFSFMSTTAADIEVVLGDGRLTLEAAPARHFGVIVLDAFTSDAVPTHLLTREALELYLAKLADGGLLVFNVSNRFLNFEPMLAALGHDLGLTVYGKNDTDLPPNALAQGRTVSRFVAMGRQESDLAPLVARPGWTRLAPQPGVAVWTDRYCDLLSLLQ